jgi:Tfp pilus assembly protein PilO
VSKLTERQRLVLTIAVAALLTGGLLALILTDRNQIDSMQGEISQLDQRIQVANVEIRRIPDREDKVLVFRAVEDRELAILPTKQKISGFHRNLSTFLASAGLSFKELPESEAVESELAQGIYVTRTTLSCQGDSASLLKFLNMIEDDPRLVAVKGLRIQAASNRVKPGSNEVPQHDIEVNLETYFYNPKTGVQQDVHIPNGDARLQAKEIREAISAFQPERPDTYVLRPAASRRDPLVDPREERPTTDPEELKREWAQQEEIVLDVERRLDDVNEMLEKEKAFLAAGDLFRRDRQMAETDVVLNDVAARLSQIDSMKSVVISELVARVENVRSRLEEVRTSRAPRDMTVPRDVAEGTLAKVVALFDKGQYNDVGTLCTSWAQYIQGKKMDADAQPSSEAILALRPRAKVLADFQAIPLKVTGTIVNERDPQRSIVMVNDQPRSIGDTVDKDGEITVGDIERDRVLFVYKGEKLWVTRQHGRPEEGKEGHPGIQAVRTPR